MKFTITSLLNNWIM